MSYKVKSLVYFFCFLVSAMMYYGIEHNAIPESSTFDTELDDAKPDQLAANELTELKAIK